MRAMNNSAAAIEILEDRLFLSTTDYTFSPTAAGNVYNGHDLYVKFFITPVADAGGYDSIFLQFDNVDPHVSLAASLTKSTFVTDNKSLTYSYMKLQNFAVGESGYYLYNPSGSYTSCITARIHTDGDATLNNRTLRLSWRAETTNGSGTGLHVYKTGYYDFNVLAVPNAVTASFTAPAPAIPVLSSSNPSDLTWEGNFLKYGRVYGVPSYIQGNSQGDETGAWYYDGERVMFQAEDYLGDDLFHDASQNYEHVYRDLYINAHNPPTVGNGWRNFAEGIGMDYLRSGDADSLRAVEGMDDNGVYRNGDTNHNYCRETAYALDTALVRDELDGINPVTDSHTRQLVDLNLAMIDQWVISKKVPSTEYVQPFYFALTSEALIKYYEASQKWGMQDNIIPPMIKSLTDWMWQETWQPSSNSFMMERYDPYNPATRYNSSDTRDLNLLIVPMFGWLYHTYGDSTYQVNGDVIFRNGVLGANLLSKGKTFSQNYRWSDKYVMWRQQVPNASDRTAAGLYNLTDTAEQWVDYGSGGYAAQLITWQTSERTDGIIEYGTTTSYGTTSRLNPYLLLDHSQVLTQLSPGQLYHYRVRSTDPSGNTVYSVDRTFVAAGADASSPEIRNLHITSKFGTSVTFSFETNEDAIAAVDFGATSAYGTTVNETLRGRKHTMTWTASPILPENRMYHFRVKATDLAGNTITLPDMLFNTTGMNDTNYPSVSITAPAGGPLMGTVTFTASATDPEAMAGVQFKLGDNLLEEDYTAPYSTTFDTTKLADRFYSLTAVARDTADWTATSSRLIVAVANNAFIKGDCNGDGVVNGQDIYGFLKALAAPETSPLAADCSGDWIVNGQDIKPFLDELARPRT